MAVKDEVFTKKEELDGDPGGGEEHVVRGIGRKVGEGELVLLHQQVVHFLETIYKIV